MKKYCIQSRRILPNNIVFFFYNFQFKQTAYRFSVFKHSSGVKLEYVMSQIKLHKRYYRC